MKLKSMSANFTNKNFQVSFMGDKASAKVVVGYDK